MTFDVNGSLQAAIELIPGMIFPVWAILALALLISALILFVISIRAAGGTSISKNSPAHKLAASQHSALDDLPKFSRGPAVEGEGAAGGLTAGIAIGALGGTAGSLSLWALLTGLAGARSFSPPPSDPSESRFPYAELSELASGRMTYGIPERMPVQQAQIVEVRIGSKDTPRLEYGFVSSVAPKSVALNTVDHMSVNLRGDPDCFNIKPLSPQVQDISSVAGEDPGFELFGRWVFEVRPLKTGKHNLFVIVGGEINGSSGRAAKLLPEREFPVLVHVGWGRILSSILRMLAGLMAILATTLIGLAVQDYWWTPLRSMISVVLPLADN